MSRDGLTIDTDLPTGATVPATSESAAAAFAATTSQGAAAPSSFSEAVAAGAEAEGTRPRAHRRPVLVATDAIGLGLNLHIRRIVFFRLQKYAGGADGAPRPLTSAEIRQLAGRAGRRSGVWGDTGGLVSCMEGEDFDCIKQAIQGNTDAVCLERAALVPSLPQLIAFCEELERQETAGETAAAGREKDLQRVLSSLAVVEEIDAERQVASGDTLVNDAFTGSYFTSIRRESGVTGAAERLRSERDATRRSSAAAAAAACRRCDGVARSAQAARDAGAAAAGRNYGSVREAGANAETQRSDDDAAAGSDGINVVHLPSRHCASFSYAEAIRCFVDLLQVDPLYFVPPHKLNLILTVVHALSDVPLLRQQLFTFCLAPLPFSSPYPFFKHMHKRAQQRQEQHEQQQRSAGQQGEEGVQGQQQDAAGLEDEGYALQAKRGTGRASRSQPAGVTTLTVRAASTLTGAQSGLSASHAQTDAEKYGGTAEEEDEIEGEEAAADALGVGGGSLPAAALAAAGLSPLLLNALRTFAILLGSCGHVPLPPHVFTAASDEAATSAAGAAAPELHGAPDLLQHQKEPTTVERHSPSEEQHEQRIRHRSHQQNQQEALDESGNPAAAAPVQTWWCNVSHAIAAAAEHASPTHPGDARQRTRDEEMIACNGRRSRPNVTNVRILASSTDALAAEGHPAAQARTNLVSAKDTAFELGDKIYREIAAAVHGGETFRTEMEAQEEDKRYAERLLLLEENYQIVDLYVWLARKFPAAFVDLPLALQVQRTLTEAIDAHLRGPL